jgi:hypothetical protein
MLQHALQAVLVVVALASVAEDAHGAHHHRRGGVVDYLFGGYGPGPFGYGDFSYAGSTSHTVMRHRVLVPSFTTRLR